MNEAKINSIIEAAIQRPVKEAVAIATNQLLSEAEGFKVGEEVAIVDELTTMGGFVGKGKIKAISDNLSGQVEVELPNGTVVHTQQSLLMKI